MIGTDKRSSGYIITSLHIRLQAHNICKDSSFKESNRWAQRLMRRHGLALSQKTKITKKLLKDLQEKINLLGVGKMRNNDYMTWKQETKV